MTDEPTAIVKDLDAKRQERAHARKRSLLPSPAPAVDAAPAELAAWLTVVLGQGADRVDHVERWGRGEDARAVVVLASGRRITFPELAAAFNEKRLVRIVMGATGAQLPPYTYGDVLQIAGAIVRLAELRDESDDRTEAHAWGTTFLRDAAQNTLQIAEATSPAGRYELLSITTNWRVPDRVSPLASPAEQSPIVLDESSGDRYVRTSDFAKHARKEHGRALSWASLHGRMGEIGWQHLGELEQRQPRGTNRIKTHLYRVPAGWEDQ